MSVSIRTFIQWENDAPAEPTTTLVLTTPRRRFIDLRFLLTTPHTTPPTLHPPLPFTTPAAALAVRRPELAVGEGTSLDWAFVGTTSRTPPAMDGSQHATWKHELDSRYSDASTVIDEGACYPEVAVLPDGSMEAWEREEGFMFNARYTEGWRDLPIPTADNGLVVLALEHSAPDGTQAHVIRIGDYIQGLLRRADGSFVAERWIRRPGTAAEHADFELICATGRDRRDSNSLSQIGCDLAMLADMRDYRNVGLSERRKAVDEFVDGDRRVWRALEVWGGKMNTIVQS